MAGALRFFIVETTVWVYRSATTSGILVQTSRGNKGQKCHINELGNSLR